MKSTNAAKGKFSIGLLSLFLLVMMSQSPAGGAMAPESSETTYKTKCAMCHGLDGSAGNPTGKKLKIRDLRSAEVQKQTDAQLLAIISKGKGKMPADEGSLGADVCKQLVAHIREMAKKK